MFRKVINRMLKTLLKYLCFNKIKIKKKLFKNYN